MDFGIASVAAITAIVYVIGIICKASKLADNWIPAVCGVCGGIIGAVALWCGMPDFPAADYINAIAIGIVSGLAATGVNQAVKQLSQLGTEVK